MHQVPLGEFTTRLPEEIAMATHTATAPHTISGSPITSIETIVTTGAHRINADKAATHQAITMLTVFAHASIGYHADATVRSTEGTRTVTTTSTPNQDEPFNVATAIAFVAGHHLFDAPITAEDLTRAGAHADTCRDDTPSPADVTADRDHRALQHA